MFVRSIVKHDNVSFHVRTGMCEQLFLSKNSIFCRGEYVWPAFNFEFCLLYDTPLFKIATHFVAVEFSAAILKIVDQSGRLSSGVNGIVCVLLAISDSTITECGGE